MAEDRPEGLVRLLAEGHDPAKPPVERGEQLGLLPSEGGEAKGGEVAAASGPGRRPGSKNRRTAEWAAYIDQRYGSPLEALARVMAAGPEALRVQLGCERVEAFDRWVRVTEAVMPYLHQKLPTAVDVQGSAMVPIVVGLSAEGAARIGASAADLGGVLEVVVDQGVSEDGDEQSNGEGSNDAG